MNLIEIYRKWRDGSKAIPARGTYFDYSFASSCIDEAATCLNKQDGGEFLQGLIAGHMPIAQSVGGHLQYFDALVEYAKQTQDDPEGRLTTLIELAEGMNRAPRCGLRFLTAQLILAYGCVYKYPPDETLANNIVRHTGLMAEASTLLELFSEYAN